MVTIGIVRFDADTGKELTYYTSRSAVAQEGYDAAHVRKVIRGERDTHDGFGWKVLSTKATRKLVEKFGTHAAIPAARASKIIR
jgi:hypothetical protein